VLCNDYTLCIAEPVIGNSTENDDEDDDGSHQMVMSWTLADWKVCTVCKLHFVTELSKDDVYVCVAVSYFTAREGCVRYILLT